MKQAIKISLIALVLTALAFIPPTHNIAGHWMVYYQDGHTDYLDLNPDGTFKNFNSDGKSLHQGNYKYNDDVFSINDKEGCGDDYWATYKFTFYGEDSVSFTAIEDSCTPRREAINNGGLKRLKNE